MSSSNNNNASLAYVDLSTQVAEDSLAVFGGADAVNIFVSVHRKVINHSPIPIAHRVYSGQADFGNTVEWALTRVGDYITHSWLRIVLPSVAFVGGTGKWVDDVAQCLVSHLSFTFTDLEVYKFDYHFINFWANHTVPESKWNAYQYKIGNDNVTNVLAASINAVALILPLPMFYARQSDDGANASLPVSSLPFNELRCKIDLRDAADLIVTDAPAVTYATPKLVSVQMWSNYIIVPVEHRVVMSKIERDYWIEQVQTSYAPFKLESGQETTNTIDVRHPYIVKYYAFAVQNYNRLFSDEASGAATAFGVQPTRYSVGQLGSGAETETVAYASLRYDNTSRLDRMPIDYFVYTEAYYKWPAVTRTVGWMSYSYAHMPYSIKHTGGTNLSVLANTTWDLYSDFTLNLGGGGILPAGTSVNNFRIVMMTVNSQVIKIKKGSGGFLT
jgi:hypothetical protein